MSTIELIKSHMILDSRGNPTIETVIKPKGVDRTVRASVPSGASTGKDEALELRDKDPNRWNGKGVEKALANIRNEIFPEISSINIFDQLKLDQKLIDLDGTENKSRLGANAILSVSLAVAKAAAEAKNLPLFKYIAELYGEPNPHILPIPMVSVIEGGTDFAGPVKFQSIMVFTTKEISYSESLRIIAEIYQGIRKYISSKNYEIGVGPEGGMVPRINSHMKGNKDPLEFMNVLIEFCVNGIVAAGYEPGEDVGIGLDWAASIYYMDELYRFDKELSLTSSELLKMHLDQLRRYPIFMLEDPFSELDIPSWKDLNTQKPKNVILVGDDLTATNPKIIRKYSDGLIQGATVAPTHVGTLSETLEAIKVLREIGQLPVTTHRSNETEDSFISHLSVGTNIPLFKGGGILRGERVAKYNELLRIGELLGGDSSFAHLDVWD